MARGFWMKLIVCGSLLASVAQADAPYINHELKFSLVPPNGWIQRPGDKNLNMVVAFVEPEERPAPTGGGIRHESDAEFLRRVRKKLSEPADGGSTFQANITVLCAPSGSVTLREYTDETRQRAQKALHEQRAKGGSVIYQIIRERPRKLAGLPAIERTTQVQTPTGDRVNTREVVCIQQGRLFTITLAAPRGSLGKYNSEFDRTLGSFVWK